MNKASDIWQASGNIIYKTTKVCSYAILFGVEKLDWCGYPMRKNVEDIFIRFDMIHECDRHTRANMKSNHRRKY